jgi:hypothetical protein
VTVDVADELRRRFVEYDEVSESVLKFLEATNRRSKFRDVDWWPGEGRSPVAKEQLHAAADARATFIKSLADNTVIRAYRTHGPWGTPMDIMERFYIAAAAFCFLIIAAMALLW